MWSSNGDNSIDKDLHLPLAGSLRVEHLFREGTPAPRELKKGHFPMAQTKGDSSKHRLGDVSPGGGEEPTRVTSAPRARGNGDYPQVQEVIAPWLKHRE